MYYAPVILLSSSYTLSRVSESFKIHFFTYSKTDNNTDFEDNLKKRWEYTWKPCCKLYNNMHVLGSIFVYADYKERSGNENAFTRALLLKINGRIFLSLNFQELASLGCNNFWQADIVLRNGAKTVIWVLGLHIFHSSKAAESTYCQKSVRRVEEGESFQSPWIQNSRLLLWAVSIGHYCFSCFAFKLFRVGQKWLIFTVRQASLPFLC